MRKLENSELERKSIQDFKTASKTPLILILDDIRSLNNIGSVFRTADAFLIEKIYLCGITAIPPNKEIHKTALGATETVTWEYHKNILEVIETLKKEAISVLAIEQVEKAILLNNFDPKPNKKYALIFKVNLLFLHEKTNTPLSNFRFYCLFNALFAQFMRNKDSENGF